MRLDWLVQYLRGKIKVNQQRFHVFLRLRTKLSQFSIPVTNTVSLVVCFNSIWFISCQVYGTRSHNLPWWCPTIWLHIYWNVSAISLFIFMLFYCGNPSPLPNNMTTLLEMSELPLHVLLQYYRGTQWYGPWTLKCCGCYFTLSIPSS